MLNKIIRYSLNNRLLILVASVLLLFAGLYTSMKMDVDVFPDLNAPTVVVMTEAPGMAPEEVERLVTFPVETALNGATDVRRVRSSSTTGFSVVWVEFNWGTDIYRARQITSEKLAVVGESLPEGVGTPTLGPQSSILGEMMIIGLTSDSTSLRDLRTLADWTIRPRLLSIGGVAQVTVIGGEMKEYQILLDLPRMKQYGVTLDEVLNAAREMNRNANGGILYEYGNEYIVRGAVATTDVDAIAKAVVKRVDGVPVLMGDVAEVKIGDKAPKLGTASVRANPAVLLTVTKQPNTSTLDLTEKLLSSMDELQKNMPADVTVSTDIFRQSHFIESSINNVQKSLYEGAIFVVIVLFFFLMNVRTTLISLVALPLSLLFSILALHFMGLTINTMSLGGMAIAIGSLVDDAIVDVENVYKHLRENRLLPPGQRKPIVEVVFEASREVRMPILNSTLIIIVTFIPLFFLTGMEGRMLVPLGIAFIVALFASTVVALTLTPVLCSYLLGKGKTDKDISREPFVARTLKKYYGQALEWALRHRTGVLGGTIALFAAAMITFFTLGRSFLPPFNEGSFTINVSTLPGISLEESDNIGRRAEELLLEVPEIQTVARKTGRAELDEHALGVNTSEIEAPFVLGDRSHAEVVADVRKKLSVIPGVNIEIGQPISHRIDAMLSGTQARIAIKLFGDDLNRMFMLGNQIKKNISAIDGVVDLNVEQQIERPQLKITPRREMLARYGVSLSEFAEFIDVALAGEVVSQVYEGSRTFDLTVKVKDDERSSAAKIGDLMVDTQDGKVPLSYLAEIKSATGPNTINRENVKRKIVISANVSDRDLRSVVDDIRERIDETVVLPEGYFIEYGGPFESEEAASRTLSFVSLFSLLVVFLLLYNQFRSVSQSAVILLNLPLALIGGVFILRFTTGEISIPAIIGFISLFGIATRNGMLLVSHYNTMLSEGNSLHDTILRGSLDRLNPILMTALTSALALIPLALGGDLPGNEIQSPMAKVILGGLITSTFLNAFVVPVVYWIMNRKKRKSMRNSFLCLFVFAVANIGAQNNMADILASIETNNPELKAGAQIVLSQKAEVSSQNTLEDPNFEFEHLWGADNAKDRKYDISVSQSFDFPSLYVQRNKIGNLKRNLYDGQQAVLRQQILLQAKELCLQVIYLNRCIRLGNERQAAADELVKLYRERLTSGDANILDVNKIEIEQLNITTSNIQRRNELAACLAQLQALNGGEPLNLAESALTEYSDRELPASFDDLKEQALQSDPELQMLRQENQIAGKEVSLNRAGWLPKFELGYRHAYELGERFNGLSVGVSIPLFANRKKVKIAKAQAVAGSFTVNNKELQTLAALQSSYNEAVALKDNRERYELLTRQNNFELLQKALASGKISMVEYLVDATQLYEAFENKLSLEYEYQLRLARMYKFEL